MTTIAYRDGIMAADTQMSRGGELAFGAQKIFQTEKFTVGIAGSYSNIRPLYDFFVEHEDEIKDAGDLHREWDNVPDYGDGFTALIVDREGRIWNAINSPPVLVPPSYDAIGSGGGYAMGAMYMGASAQEAIRAARELDVHTGGSVMLFRTDG